MKGRETATIATARSGAESSTTNATTASSAATASRAINPASTDTKGLRRTESAARPLHPGAAKWMSSPPTRKARVPSTQVTTRTERARTAGTLLIRPTVPTTSTSSPTTRSDGDR